ncbi:MAG: sensory box protein [Alphaproteobacteria bacterium]|nr:sensory box protein [Alphaproteobacteria bacterium]
MTNWLVPLVQDAGAPFMPAVEALGRALAEVRHRPYVYSDNTVAAFAVSTAIVGFLSVSWAGWMHGRLGRLKARMRRDHAKADAARFFQEALVNGATEGIVLMRGAGQERQYMGGGKDLLDACMDSPQAGQILRALDRLANDGTAFVLTARCAGDAVIMRGMPVAGRAVLYFYCEEREDDQEQYRDILEALPVAIWKRDLAKGIGWANRAFLDILGLDTLEDAIAANATIDWSEHDLAARAIEGHHAVAGHASTIMKGEPRTFSLQVAPVSATAVAGLAADISDTVRQKAKQQLALDAQEDMLERIPFAVAVFNAEQKLVRYNGAYARLWSLPTAWLDATPLYGDILDRLREKRRLPEQRVFSDWKQGQLQALSIAGGASEQTWHLPQGASVHIAIQPHLQGGMFVVYEDITERLKLESSLNLLTQVQKATLDTLDEGIAIFGTDGRLVLHNALFARMWQLTEAELADQPHFAEIANICTTRIGRDGIWGIVSCGVNSATPESFGEWGKAVRADGRIISLALSRLPNGATVVTFSDLTDLERFSAAHALSAHAAA